MIPAREFVRSLPVESEDYRWLADAYGAAAADPDWAAELFDALIDAPTEVLALEDVVRLYITDDAIQSRAEHLMQRLKVRPNDDRAGVAIRKIATYHNRALRNVLNDYLQFVLRERPDDRCDRVSVRHAAEAWRDCAKGAVVDLIKHKAASQTERRLMWHALILSRDDQALAHAWDLDGNHKSGYDEFTFWNEVCHAGIESTGLGKPYAPLRTERPLYVKWDPSYLGVEVAPVLPERPTLTDVHWHRHPTRAFAPDIPGEFRFGGAANGSCGVCGGPLHHLLTLDPIPEPLLKLVRSVPKLELVTCLSCCGWESSMLYFVHNDDGTVAGPWSRLTRLRTPQFPAAPFQATTVRLGHTSPRWDTPDSNDSRVGGRHFDFGWTDPYPKCAECDKRMSFVFQLGEDLPREDGETHMFGDGGSLFAYWCDRCRISANHFQSS